MLKTVFFVLSVLGIGYSMFGKDRDEVRKVFDDCMATTGVTHDQIHQVMNGTLQADDKIKATLVCAFKKFGVMDDTGKLNKDAIKTGVHGKFPDDATEQQFISECLVDKSSAAETAEGLFNCAKKYMPPPPRN